MSDTNQDARLDVQGTTGGKVTTETTTRRARTDAEWRERIDPKREERTDTLIGEIVRFLVRADTAAFARIYAVVRIEATAQDTRSAERMRQFMEEGYSRRADGSDEAR